MATSFGVCYQCPITTTSGSLTRNIVEERGKRRRRSREEERTEYCEIN